ncbi:hypothetical protein [Dermatophilus congolensis]|uniref:hypothetical protein n=1 Tax=Dermatophilus congolensis TaxID=1863 RepID=UPI001C68C57C|nr:hypothetical protein [Dermatophilus congolensis]
MGPFGVDSADEEVEEVEEVEADVAFFAAEADVGLVEVGLTAEVFVVFGFE